jgi:hypothetical protein
MVLTGEMEILGENSVTMWMVDGWMSVEQWWNRSAGRQTCYNATLSTTNLTWTDMGSNPARCNERPMSLRTRERERESKGLLTDTLTLGGGGQKDDDSDSMLPEFARSSFCK